MDLQIRTIREDEFEPLMHALETAFGGRVEPADVERERRVTEIGRVFAAFDGDEVAGGATAVPFSMTVPGGGVVPIAGITGVGVKPSHRRRGVSTALMREQLEDVGRHGEPIAALFASEAAIYGRFGYGLASFGSRIDVRRDRTRYVRGYEPTGRVRLLDRDEGLKTFLPIYDRARRERPGMLEMDERWLDHRFAERHFGEDRKWFYAAHVTAGEADAYAVYQVKHAWPEGIPGSELQVEEVVALTPQAYADMWRFLFDVDLIDRITAWNRPADDPLLLLLREPRALRLTVGDGLWVRLVDVSAALEARGYASDGRVVFEVEDRFVPQGSGRYELAVEGGRASCRRTDAEPDIALQVNGLGSAYLGGISFARLARALQARERSPGAIARADAMFASDPAPWCSFEF